MTEAPAWEDLPPPQDLGGETPGASVEDTRPEEAICPVCEKPIIRDPSWKRMHKYHDECKSAANRIGERTRRVSTGKKEEKEADRCEEILRSFMVKAALMVSVVDRFDAACIMMNTQAVCSSFRAVCLRYADLRREFLRVPEGGSVLSLIFAGAMMGLPIAAHHGLIPSRRIAEILTRMPVMLFQLQQQLSQGEEGLQTLMREQVAEMRQAREEASARSRRDANGQHVPAS